MTITTARLWRWKIDADITGVTRPPTTNTHPHLSHLVPSLASILAVGAWVHSSWSHWFFLKKRFKQVLIIFHHLALSLLSSNFFLLTSLSHLSPFSTVPLHHPSLSFHFNHRCRWGESETIKSSHFGCYRCPICFLSLYSPLSKVPLCLLAGNINHRCRFQWTVLE